MAKKIYPGGFRLTLKTARALAVQQLGTAKGLEKEPGMPEGYFLLTFGNLRVRIHPDATDSSHRSSIGLIQLEVDLNCGPARIEQFFRPDTLAPDYHMEDISRNAHRRDALEEWIERVGPEKCHAEIDRIWKERGG